jgi:hypothetical protein
MQAQRTVVQESKVQLVEKPGGGLIATTSGELTAADVRALRVRRNDLRNELQDAAERRNSIAGRLREADIAARPGYEDRLKVLDARIIAIENEITRVGRELSAAPAEALIAAEPARSQGPDPNVIVPQIVDEIVPIVAILSVFVLAPIVITISRFFWKRSSPAPAAIRTDHATQERLEQLQQAVDAIAIEVERISEGQRYVTKVLGTRGVGAGDAEPVHVARGAAIATERG